MRGSPILRAVFLAALLALAGIPVWSLTRPQAAPPPAKLREETKRRSVDLAISATGDAELVLTGEGKEIWLKRTTPAGLTEVLDLPRGEVDLVAAVHPPAGSPTGAVRFRFSEDGETLADVTVWGDNTEIVSLPASPVTK